MSVLSRDIIQVPHLERTMPLRQCDTNLNCFGKDKIMLPRHCHRNPDFQLLMIGPAHQDVLRYSVSQQRIVLYGHP